MSFQSGKILMITYQNIVNYFSLKEDANPFLMMSLSSAFNKSEELLKVGRQVFLI